MFIESTSICFPRAIFAMYSTSTFNFDFIPSMLNKFIDDLSTSALGDFLLRNTISFSRSFLIDVSNVFDKL